MDEPVKKIHMRHDHGAGLGPAPLCGFNFKSSYNMVEDWALVNCRGCQKKRIRLALDKAGFNQLEIFQAAAEHLGVDY